MKTILCSVFLCLISVSGYSQMIALEDFVSCQKIVAKIVNQKFHDGMGNYVWIEEQEFTESSITIHKKTKRSEEEEDYTEMFKEEYLDMPWDQLTEFELQPVLENDALLELKMHFAEKFTMKYGTSIYERDLISIYLLKEDSVEMKSSLFSIQKKFREEGE